jgi:hypothetical protein
MFTDMKATGSILLDVAGVAISAIAAGVIFIMFAAALALDAAAESLTRIQR